MSESASTSQRMPTETGAPGGHGHGHGHGGPVHGKELALLSLGALGVVYGDIGTSPLYAMGECLRTPKPDGSNLHHAVAATPDNVLGVMSLFFWSLTLVVVIKYLILVLRADNKGEGGILALAALVAQHLKLKQQARDAASPPPLGPDGKPKRRIKLAVPILLALFGAGLLYGDGVITPAISVLSAVEGLSEQSPSLSYLVVPISAAILIGLFLVQRLGTHRLGTIFGYVMLIWFVAIGALGARYVVGNPEILAAINPAHAVRFIAAGHLKAFFLLGSVVLCVTGGEALYADMGHFGRAPIRWAWTVVVFPGLLLNYFGQGALFLHAHATNQHISNPFYDLVPSALIIPMVLLATMATIIASQALISGAFSLTHQAVQLGYLPRVTVIHTSEKSEGQIYIPEVNYLLLVACVALVLSYRSSSSLAAAYGIAVTGTMGITSYLYYLVCRHTWRYSLGTALALFVPMVVIDVAFFSANFVKIAAGGWFPLAVGAGVFAIMTTWWRGRVALSAKIEDGTIAEDLFFEDVRAGNLPRVPGMAVFMTSSPDGIPNVLLHHVKHNKVLHRHVVLLSIATENVPTVTGDEALSVRAMDLGFYRVLARVGFVDQTDVQDVLARCVRRGLLPPSHDATYYLGRQTLLLSKQSEIAKWRRLLFSFLARNSRPPTAFYNLPPNRVVELGLQIEL